MYLSSSMLVKDENKHQSDSESKGYHELRNSLLLYSPEWTELSKSSYTSLKSFLFQLLILSFMGAEKLKKNTFSTGAGKKEMQYSFFGH